MGTTIWNSYKFYDGREWFRTIGSTEESLLGTPVIGVAFLLLLSRLSRYSLIAACDTFNWARVVATLARIARISEGSEPSPGVIVLEDTLYRMNIGTLNLSNTRG